MKNKEAKSEIGEYVKADPVTHCLEDFLLTAHELMSWHLVKQFFDMTITR